MLCILMILSVICRLDLSSARPAEESTKFSLNIVENDANNILSSTLEQENQLSNKASSNAAAIITTSDNSNPSRRSLTSVQTTTPIVLFPSEQQETTRLENETSQAILERPKPDNVRQLLNSFLNPAPIVDRIKEKEKYGNTGDTFFGFGSTIVNAYENLSNFLNTVVDLPINAAKQTSRGITETLNQIGARLIGLQ